jgi:hypothetical protein
MRRKALLDQLQEAGAGRKADDAEEWDRVMDKVHLFNEQYPSKAIGADTIRSSRQTRSRNQALQEQGVPRQRGDRPIAEEINRIYPRVEVERRVVR